MVEKSTAGVKGAAEPEDAVTTIEFCPPRVGWYRGTQFLGETEPSHDG